MSFTMYLADVHKDGRRLGSFIAATGQFPPVVDRKCVVTIGRSGDLEYLMKKAALRKAEQP